MPIFFLLLCGFGCWWRELAYTVPNDFDALYSSAIDALGFVNEDFLNELAYHFRRKLLNIRVLPYNGEERLEFYGIDWRSHATPYG